MKSLLTMLFLGSVLGLAIVLSSGQGAFAEQRSINIAVGCSIPAVPGLNAPLLTQETLNQDNDAATQENAGNQNKNNAEEDEILLAKSVSSHSGKTVNTIYSR